MELDRREILRYLGYRRKDVPDAQTQTLVEELAGELTAVMAPRSVYRIFPIKDITDGVVDLGFVQIESRNLAKNMTGCTQAAFLAATLGGEAELLLQKYGRLQVSRAVILQAVATEAIEKYCDCCEEEILAQLPEGTYLRPRFSPGYGDFSLEFQRRLLQILETPKRIGLTLTDSLLMMPSKSVTAVIGISEERTDCKRSGCEVCEKTDCLYRRD